ncbi:putative thiol methyltransferase [Saccharata proteae CBS 121410]|uniref:Thiol methyltransferase n=1 Tax=Saccharata proteae CBS 121410 TaxID=1314787 RepID=A0A9P4HWG2_9PEZI|nr:putative thiol methyltransferase [Saccharata proteae CBS 121410]
MSASRPPDQPTDARERLKQHFTAAESAHPSRWDDLWKTGDFLPWDKGFPNPALEDLFTKNTDLVGGSPLKADGSRKRALVPGCGKGYDVLLLSSFGYDAVGLEASSNAVAACERYRTENEGKDLYAVKDEKVGAGECSFVCGDFFKDGWLSQVGGGGDLPKFDIIYDYTFLSALPPSFRPAWALRMSNLLSESGGLVCIEFPTYKPPSTGGPPWALPPPVYEQHLARPGEELPYDAEGYVIENKSENGEVPRNQDGLLRIAHWQPERTHEIGKGTDWIGIWRHA